MIDPALLLAIDPAAVTRVRRLQFAVRLVRNGVPRAEIARRIIAVYDVSRKTAYRITAVAFDVGEYHDGG